MKIEIKRYTNEVVAVINDHYNLRLGNLLNKTDDEIKIIAEAKYNEILATPKPPPSPTKEEILKEKYKSIDKTKTNNADLDKQLKAIEEFLGV